MEAAITSTGFYALHSDHSFGSNNYSSTPSLSIFADHRDDYDFSNSSSCLPPKAAKDNLVVQSILGLCYALVFTAAVFGNSLVLYVVATNRAMQTPTNLFITNLAFSDIVVNFTSLWVTPLYIYIGSWVFGGVACFVVSLFQGTSIFISTLTLTAVAVDRYLAIVHPLKPRMNVSVCIMTIVSIWICSLMLIAPYVMNMEYKYFEDCDYYACFEKWTIEELKHVYGVVVMVLQYGVPFAIIAFCYIQISLRLWKPSQRMAGARSAAREATELARKRRLVKMLMLMVVIFMVCWLPINIVNIVRDSYRDMYMNYYFTLIFLVTHLIAVSGTCWNPILYGFLNENFRREFVAVLPCFHGEIRVDRSSTIGRKRKDRKKQKQQGLLSSSKSGAAGTATGSGGAGAEGISHLNEASMMEQELLSTINNFSNNTNNELSEQNLVELSKLIASAQKAQRVLLNNGGVDYRRASSMSAYKVNQFPTGEKQRNGSLQPVAYFGTHLCLDNHHMTTAKNVEDAKTMYQEQAPGTVAADEEEESMLALHTSTSRTPLENSDEAYEEVSFYYDEENEEVHL